MLDLFEAGWSRHVRRRGRLTFQDMELILAGHEFAENLSRPMLSQVPGDDERLRIDYRLDARYDHWLLDEFQDTNYVQWSVIQNLIDEAIQDNSNERTLFQVGDVKQAIYAWRGGDTRLFHDIFARYNAGKEKRIVARPLNVSWRSGHDVIEMVNKVFGTESSLRALEVPNATMNRWQWGTHTVAGINDKLPGYAALYNPIPLEGEKVEREDRFAVVVGLLEKIQPVARGLSCAILVQSNEAGRAMVDYIRAHSPSRIPVMSESEIAIATDNPLTLTLLSLLKCAAHPGDTLAWGHLRMTPFLTVLPAWPSALAEQVLRLVFDEGFETTLRHWLSRLLETGIALDAFSLRRAEELSLAARQFDQTGNRDIDEFLAYAERYTVREPDTRRAVQVMTVHKSKGLTFDCVLLPDLEGSSITNVRRGIGVKRDAQRQVQWVFDLPPSEIVRSDETLAKYREEREAEAAYEELCKFYVALTRARCANYLITSPRADRSQSMNFVQLLELTLAHAKGLRDVPLGTVTAELLYESKTSATDEQWFDGYPFTQTHAEIATAEAATEAKLPSSGRVRPTRRTPSGSETSVVTAKQLFSRGGRFARAYGTLVHALYEQIEWLDESQPEALRALWAGVATPDESIRQRAEEEVRQSLGVAAIAEILSRPSPEAICWREKRFEILLKNEWLSGTFDRVVIEPHRALILDFKTDKVDSDEAFQARINGYRPQLATYREVLHRMTGLPMEAIDCQLLFTHRRELVTV